MRIELIALVALALAIAAMGRYGQNPEVVYNFVKVMLWCLMGVWGVATAITLQAQKRNLTVNFFGCLFLTVIAQVITYSLAA